MLAVLRSQRRLPSSILPSLYRFYSSRNTQLFLTTRQSLSNPSQLSWVTSRTVHTHNDYPVTIEEVPTRKLFVGGLPYETTEEEVARVFERYGKLDRVHLLVKGNGESRGVCFVEFKEKDDAVRVREIHEYTPFVFLNREVRVRFSESPGQRKPYVPKERVKTPNNTLFVERVPYQAKENDLLPLFSVIGKVASVTIPRRDGKAKGVAFVRFENIEDAQRAVEVADSKPFQVFNRKMEVSYVDPVRNPSTPRDNTSGRR